MKVVGATVGGLALLLSGAVGLAMLPALEPAPALAGGSAAPAQYAAHVEAAAASCDGLPAPVLAAQLEQESGWNPRAVSSAGAQGLAQFLPSTWATYGVDADRDGSADPFDPVDAIWSAARYGCALKRAVGALGADPVPLVLAAYNAGPGAVLAARGVPPIAETQVYVAAVLARVELVIGGQGEEGLTPAALRVRELVRIHFGLQDIGGFARDGHAPGSDHYTGRAIDVMLTPLGPANTALGWRVALHLQANARELEITYIIWQARIWSVSRAAEGWRPYHHPQGYTDATRLHLDHVHVSVR